MATLPLLTSTQTSLDGSGSGTCSIGPTSQGEVWTLSVIGVRCLTNVSESICQVYIGPAGSTSYLVGTTTWGSTGDSDTDISFVLNTGQQVTASWTNGDAGTTAYLSVVGSKTT